MRVDPYVLCCFKRELPIDCAMPATGYSLAELLASQLMHTIGARS